LIVGTPLDPFGYSLDRRTERSAWSATDTSPLIDEGPA